MIVSLHDWGQGNLYYLFSTFYLLLQSTISVLLAEEVYFWVFAPKAVRITSIVLSYISISFWLISLITEIVLAIGSKDAWSIAQRVIMAYTLCIHVPQLIPSIYIIVKEALVDDIEIARRYYKKGYTLPAEIESQLEYEEKSKNAEKEDQKVIEQIKDIET